MEIFPIKPAKSRLSGMLFRILSGVYSIFMLLRPPLVSRVHILFDQPVKFHTVSVDSDRRTPFHQYFRSIGFLASSI